MADYVGTESVIAVQKALRARSAEFERQPLLSNGGRVLNVLDADAYGWDRVRAEAQTYGIVGLTKVARDATFARLAREFGTGLDCPHWDIFTGTADTVSATCRAVVSSYDLPGGWRLIHETMPDDRLITATQRVNLAAGVMPPPAYFLRSDYKPSMLTALTDETGAVVACASGNMRYHPEGPMAGGLFAGGVSVAEAHRRKGLGRLVNAALLLESQKALGWTHVLEQARATNLASVGMIERCGLTHEPGKATIQVSLRAGFDTR